MTTQTEIRSGEALARLLLLDNLSLAASHVPEMAKGCAVVALAAEGRRYESALAGLEFVALYFASRDADRPLTDDESIASRHLSSAREQLARLVEKGV